MISGNVNYSYYTAVITQMEKGFGLSSSFTGLLKNVDNIGFIVTIVIISHFLRSANKPKVLAVATTVSALSIFIFTVPHFIYGAPHISHYENTFKGSGNHSLKSSKFELCRDGSETREEGCSDAKVSAGLSAGPVFFFVGSMILQGMADAPRWTLSMTYLDDNSKKTKTPLYFGFLFGTRAVSPIVGFLLGAWTTKVYVDLSDPGIDERDPRWVGAWWLGFIICGCITIIWAFPLLLFPATFANSPPQNENFETLKGKSIREKFTELWVASKRLFRNVTYVCIVLGVSCNMSFIGLSTFTPKYMESFYGQTASRASIYTGVVMALSWAVGPIVSGSVLSRLNLSHSQILRVVVVLHLIIISGFVIIIILHCPSSDWAGTISFSGTNITQDCNRNCSCDLWAYNPVCGSDGLNYYSPCYAGCTVEYNTSETTKMFTGCDCIIDGVAKHGQCERSCWSFNVYLVLSLVLQLLNSIIIVPLYTVTVHCVDASDKALALATSGLVSHLAAFPSPIIFGATIDSACLVKQSSCQRQGACLLYDQTDFKNKLHGLPIGFMLAAMTCYLIAAVKTTTDDKRLVRNNPPSIAEQRN